MCVVKSENISAKLLSGRYCVEKLMISTWLVDKDTEIWRTVGLRQPRAATTRLGTGTHPRHIFPMWFSIILLCWDNENNLTKHGYITIISTKQDPHDGSLLFSEIKNVLMNVIFKLSKITIRLLRVFHRISKGLKLRYLLPVVNSIPPPTIPH